MGTFQEVFLIILSLCASLKLVGAFIHETFLVYELETFQNCKETKHIILCDIWLIVENYFQKMLSPPPPSSHKKSTPPFKNSKSASPPPVWPTLHIFQIPPAERVIEHCELAFLLLVILFSITDLDMICFLRKIFPPSEVLEVCIYHLQCFLKGEIPTVGGWEILASGNLARSDSDHLNLLES